ncbi:hypothetical protein HPB52_020294 [Rhipicephalus sanguineus]|uniref:Uncharacterized protein n=1 Tax=Rhipicephalus sanguineus TaxID=34632 RepID=A0A9D4PSA8_RHISA|nr:hypothetical protein HPB52_020294 [Rhipicephalus sanguineus]
MPRTLRVAAGICGLNYGRVSFHAVTRQRLTRSKTGTGDRLVSATELRDRYRERLGDKPQVEVWFLGKGEGEMLAAHGLKRRACSHIAALLFYVEYGLRAREERSCIDGSKSWFPPAMKKLEVRPVAEMGLSSSATKKWRIDAATSATCAPQR